MTTPTILTLIRIGLIPVFVLLFYLPFEWARVATAIVFSLAAITDWLDGYLARKMGQTTAFGAFLDPVADKLMVVVALVMLVQSNPSPWMALPAAIIIGREITVSSLREWMAEIGHSGQVAVSKLGKLKTTCQLTALIMLLYRDPLLGIPIETIGFVFLYAAAILTLWSMVIYLQKAWPSLKKSS